MALGGAAGRVAGQTVRNVKVVLSGDVDAFTRQFGLAGDAAAELVSVMTEVEDAFHRTARRVGFGLQGIAVAAQGMMTWATMTASSWEDAFARVEKTVDAPVTKLREVDREIRQMSLEIPVRAENLAGLGSLAGQLGVTVDAIDEYTEAAAKLGAATDLNADQAIFQLSQFANIMGTSEEEVNNLGSALVGLGNNTASTEAAILDFSQRIAGVGNVVGLTEAQVMGIAAAMASAGVEAERGGTATSKVLLAINEAATQGGQKLDIFARAMGMTREQFQEIAQTNPGEIFTQFVEALRDAGDAATGILNALDLSDQRLIQSFLSLSNSTQDVRSTMQLATRDFREGSAMQEEYARQTDTLSQQLTILGNMFTELRRTVGHFFLPVARESVKILNSMIEPMVSLGTTIQTTLAPVLQGLAGILGIMGSTLTFVAGTVLVFSEQIAALGAAFLAVKIAQVVAGWLVAFSQLSMVAPIIAKIGAAVSALAGSAAWAGLLKALNLVKMALVEIAAGGFVAGIRALTAALGSLAVAAVKTAAAMMMNPVVLSIMALVGALKLLSMTANSAQATTEAMAASVDTLAGSMGIAMRSAEDFQNALSGLEDQTADNTAAFATANEELVRFLNTLDVGTREDFIMNIAFQMRERGATESEVKKTLEQFQKLYPSLDIDAGISTFEGAEVAKQRVDSLAESVKQLGGYYNLLPQGNVPVLSSIVGAINDLVEDESKAGQIQAMSESFATMIGRITQGGSDASRAVQELALAFEGLEQGFEGISNSEFQRDFAEFLQNDISRILQQEMGIQIELGGMFETLTPEEFLPELLKNDGLRTAMQEALRGLGFEDFQIRSIDEMERAFDRLARHAQADGFMEFIEGLNDTKPITTFEQRLRSLGEVYQQYLSSDDQGARSAFIKEQAELFAATEGYERAAEAINTYIEVKSGGNRFTAQEDPELRALITQVEEFERKASDIEMKAFERTLSSMPLSDALDALDLKMKRLDMTTVGAAERMNGLLDMRNRLVEQETSRFMGLVNQLESLEDQRENAYDNQRKRLKDLDKAEKEALDSHKRNLAEAFDITRRLQAQPTMSLQAMIFNAEDQNEVLGQWRNQLRSLQNMGLSEDVINAMGLNDPNSWQQVSRLIRDAVGNPQMISELNAQWSSRLDITGGAAEEISGDEIRENFAEQRKNLVESFDETIADLNTQINELGKDSDTSLDEAIEKAKNASSPYLRELAGEIEEMFLDAESYGGDWKDAYVEQLSQMEQATEETTNEIARRWEKMFTDLSTDVLTPGEGGGLGGIFGAPVGMDGSGNLTSATPISGYGGRPGELSAENQKAYNTSVASAQSGLPGTMTPENFDPGGEIQRMAYQMMLERGYDHGQWRYLDRLVQQESGWNPRAQNPESSAFGLFQFLDDTWATVGGTKTPSAQGQIEYGLRYIQQRYGTPQRALQHWEARLPIEGEDVGHWYAAGSVFTGPQRIGVGEAGPEAVIPLNAKGMSFMISAIQRSMPRAFGFSGGGVSNSTSMINKTEINGPITVQAQDPNEMLRKINNKKRLRNLRTMGVQEASA